MKTLASCLAAAAITLSIPLPALAIPAGSYDLANGFWAELAPSASRGTPGNILSGISDTLDFPVDPCAPDPLAGVAALGLDLFDYQSVADLPIDPMLPEQWIGGVLVLEAVTLLEDTVDGAGNGTRIYETDYGNGLLLLNECIFYPGDVTQDLGMYATVVGLQATVLSTHQFQGGQLVGFSSQLAMTGSTLDQSSDLSITAAGAYAGTSLTDPPYDIGQLTDVMLTVTPAGAVPEAGTTGLLLALAAAAMAGVRRLTA